MASPGLTRSRDGATCRVLGALSRFSQGGRPPHLGINDADVEACNLCLIGGGCNIRVVKQSRNQLHTGRATLRNTRHKPMSSEGAPLVDLSCSRCRCCTKTSSVHGRVCDHVKRIKRVLPTSSRPLARDSIWRRQAPPWPARRAGTRLNGASRGRQKRGGFPHARGKSLSFGEGGRKVAPAWPQRNRNP